MSTFYERHILPGLLCQACAAGPVMKLRKKLVPRAKGAVLELGIGGGLNFSFYDPANVAHVAGVDPSTELRARAEKARRPDGLPVTLHDARGEALPFEAGSFDCVVCTFTLCSVQSPEKTLGEARRVLKPGGRLLFCEHGLAPDGKVARWQRRLEPLWKRLTGGCHLTRAAAGSIEAAGFGIEEQESMYLARTPRFAGWVQVGSATRC